MKKEDIIKELRLVCETSNHESLETLISKLEDDIRTESAYKSNSKSKISAIKRVCKKHEKARPIFTGYHIFEDGKYEFTDTYRLFKINPMIMPVKRVGEPTEQEKEKGIETIAGQYPKTNHFYEDIKNGESVDLDIGDIMYAYKLRKSNGIYYKLKSDNFSIVVNVEYLKDVFDILGKDVTCKVWGKLKPVRFENNKGEIGILLPIG